MTTQNNSGYEAFETGVLVKVEKPEGRVSAGGIHLPSKTVDIYATQIGVIVQMGDVAFTDYQQPPKVGDKIYFAKYSGQMLEPDMTEDDGYYRIIQDSDIVLLVRK
jgi:co-chaperonin GroES (HSP10)